MLLITHTHSHTHIVEVEVAVSNIAQKRGNWDQNSKETELVVLMKVYKNLG